MYDSQIVTIFKQVLEPVLHMKYPGLPIIQSNQPSMQGIPTDSALFIHKVIDHRYGSPRTDYGFQFTPPDSLPQDMMPTNTIQVIESRFQFTALRNINTNDPAPETASDMLRYVAMVLSVDGILHTLRAKGLNPMRITNVLNPYFGDDHDQFAAHPTFDVIVQHYDHFDIPVPRITAVVPEVHAV